MWIRSQTKEDLINCNEFSLCYNGANPTDYRIRGNDIIVGKYSTKEKAIKVLDMIQQQIVTCTKIKRKVNYLLKTNEHKEDYTYGEPTFEMPQDSEVE